MAQPNKNKAGGEKIATGPWEDIFSRPFSDFFNVAASRPAKSPRNYELSNNPC
jgi:hypothetical protein